MSALPRWLLVALLAAAPAFAVPAEPGFVLAPEAAAPIRAAFERMKPAVAYESIGIERQTVLARLCATGAERSCFDVRLERRDGPCRGDAAGAFCVSFPREQPPEAARAVVRAALGTVTADAVWTPPGGTHIPGAPPPRELVRRHGATLRMVGWSIALLPGAVALGALVGIAVRRRFGRRVAGLPAAAVGLLAPAAVAVAVLEWLPLVGIWDAAMEGLLVGAGLVWASHRAFADRRDTLLALGSLAIGLLLVEVGARRVAKPPPAFDAGGEPHLFLRDALRGGAAGANSTSVAKETLCGLIYGDRYPGLTGIRWRDVATPAEHRPRAGATRRVLHVGDSMVAGLGVDEGERFTGVLERLEPGVEHVDAGIPGLGPDAYLLLVRAWLARFPFDRVVLYLYAGNDVADVDSPYPCSDWRSLMVYDGEVRLRYPDTPRVALREFGWEWLANFSPPPYLVRLLAPHSRLAAYVAGFLAERTFYLAPGEDEPDAARYGHIAALLEAAHDEVAARGASLIVVVLPERATIQARHAAPTETRLLEVAGAVPGVAAVLDPRPPLEAALAAGLHVYRDAGTPNGSQDIHWDAPGHAVIGRWLHERLPPF